MQNPSNKREYAKAILDQNLKTFLIYVTTLKVTKMADEVIHLL